MRYCVLCNRTLKELKDEERLVLAEGKEGGVCSSCIPIAHRLIREEFHGRKTTKTGR